MGFIACILGEPGDDAALMMWLIAAHDSGLSELGLGKVVVRSASSGTVTILDVFFEPRLWAWILSHARGKKNTLKHGFPTEPDCIAR